MKRVLFAAALLISIVTFSKAQPIPNEVKSTIVFIYAPDSTGKLQPYGTGFFVGVRIPEDTTRYAVYLVTAKHVLQDVKSNYLPAVFVRLNKKNGDVETLRLDIVIEGKNKNIFTHNDQSVDIAVIPALPDQNKYDFKFLPADYICKKEDYKNLNISEGSEIFFTGLFSPHTGEHKNYPIVRFGRVALITDEKILWENDKLDLFLVETASYGGNSGSPVFFFLGPERGTSSFIVGSRLLKLAGIMKGFFGEKRPIQIIETSRIPVSVSNIGISAVVPSFLLYDILFSKAVEKHRKIK